LVIKPFHKNLLLLVACDVASTVVLFSLVTYLRGISAPLFLWAYAVPALVLVIALHLIDGYGLRSDMLSLDYASMHLIATFFSCITILLLTFVFIPSGFELQESRAVILISFALLGPLTLEYRRAIYSRRATSGGGRVILFVGAKPDFDAFKEECERMGTSTPLLHADTADGYGPFEAVLESIAESKVRAEAIVVKESGREFPSELPLRLVQLCFEGTPTYTLELFNQVYWRKIPLYRINPIWLFQEGFKVAREPVFERIKRMSDMALATVGLLLASPVIVLAALAIKLEDRGPVFFAQTRIGKHRVPFRLLKLRTMKEATGTGDPYTRQGDARITRVGRWLRAGRFDELPQLWNVLRGQMSLIGPRAEWDRLVAEYEREIPCYHFRHLVKPGITGWAQVNYRYGLGVQDTLRKLEYDLYYIRNFSFMLDASIVLKTIHVMLLRKGR
jgi:exopolysaccharide biosynthesis polyprenyl glycosylphosphotransferase